MNSHIILKINFHFLFKYLIFKLIVILSRYHIIFILCFYHPYLSYFLYECSYFVNWNLGGIVIFIKLNCWRYFSPNLLIFYLIILYILQAFIFTSHFYHRILLILIYQLFNLNEKKYFINFHFFFNLFRLWQNYSVYAYLDYLIRV